MRGKAEAISFQSYRYVFYDKHSQWYNYIESTMKIHIFGLSALLLITLTLALAASNFISAEAFTASASAGVMIQQPTPTPTAIPASEIGSTDGILAMGIVIVLIITLPILFRKKWRSKQVDKETRNKIRNTHYELRTNPLNPPLTKRNFILTNVFYL